MLAHTFFRTTTFYALIAIVCFGCASAYKPVVVSGINYQNAATSVNDTLRVSYQYYVQEASRNKYYAVNERKHGVAAVAMRIENTSTVPVTITRDNFKVYSLSLEKQILSPAEYAKKVRQRGELQLLHGLWGPYISGYYVPVGLALGINNLVRASHANASCKKTMEIYEIWNKTIAPGKLLDGLVTLQAYGDEPLSFSYGNSKPVAADTSSIDEKNMVLRTKVMSGTYDYFVIPVSGSSYHVTTKIYIDGHASHIVVNDPAKGPSSVYPTDTKSLSRITKEGKQFLGIPYGNYWLFKILAGNINAYHIFSEDGITEITHIQKGNGPIVRLSPYTIHRMVDNDPEVQKLLNRGKYYDAIVLYNGKKR